MEGFTVIMGIAFCPSYIVDIVHCDPRALKDILCGFNNLECKRMNRLIIFSSPMNLLPRFGNGSWSGRLFISHPSLCSSLLGLMNSGGGSKSVEFQIIDYWEKNIKMRTKPIMATVEWFVFEVDMVENNAGYASPETPTGGRSLRFL
ncbi:unnamed protein product [Lactuca saligna]|uniref:Uncharacterized protein n=1 Tax=Lactuca saligna TaxID=75948 RepID=A0AA35VEM7_LACSI|nr:unnamed protein product [Lactuca saligna]